MTDKRAVCQMPWAIAIVANYQHAVAIGVLFSDRIHIFAMTVYMSSRLLMQLAAQGQNHFDCTP